MVRGWLAVTDRCHLLLPPCHTDIRQLFHVVDTDTDVATGSTDDLCHDSRAGFRIFCIQGQSRPVLGPASRRNHQVRRAVYAPLMAILTLDYLDTLRRNT